MRQPLIMLEEVETKKEFQCKEISVPSQTSRQKSNPPQIQQKKSAEKYVYLEPDLLQPNAIFL
jgi:hypothetical protein